MNWSVENEVGGMSSSPELGPALDRHVMCSEQRPRPEWALLHYSDMKTVKQSRGHAAALFFFFMIPMNGLE